MLWNTSFSSFTDGYPIFRVGESAVRVPMVFFNAVRPPKARLYFSSDTLGAFRS